MVQAEIKIIDTNRPDKEIRYPIYPVYEEEDVPLNDEYKRMKYHFKFIYTTWEPTKGD